MSQPALRLVDKDTMDKQKALEAALGQIERSFGKGSIMKLGQQETMDIEAISCGSLGLDIALGIGGLPKGRIIEVYGPESSGKTTLALHVLAEAQKKGGTCAFVDAEHALDPVYAKKLGVDVDELLVSQPDAGEQALEIADTLVRSGAIDVLVIDSVSPPWCRGPNWKVRWAIQPCRPARPADEPGAAQADRLDLTVPSAWSIFINQIRHEDRCDVRESGDDHRRQRPEILCLGSPGHPTDRLRSRTGMTVVGNQTRVKVVKNKMAPPFRTVEFDIMYGEGISKTGELLDLGVNAGVVEKSGSWFSCMGQRIGQGRENAKKFLVDNPEMARDIERKIRENAGILDSAMLEGPDEKEAAEAELTPADAPK